MKSREYGTWRPKNALGVERQKLYDPYNRFLKKERNERAKEYACSDVEEYYHVPATKDVSGNPYEEDEKAKQQGKSKNVDKARSMRQQLLRQVMGVLVGSVIVVTTYQTMDAKRQAAAETPAVVESTEAGDHGSDDTGKVSLSANWIWADDNSTVTVMISDENGNLVKELSVPVAISEEAATCNKEGLKTYTATVEEDGNTFSDSRTEVLQPLGHDFGEGVESDGDNGETLVTFECSRCHEHFTFTTSMTEND